MKKLLIVFLLIVIYAFSQAPVDDVKDLKAQVLELKRELAQEKQRSSDCMFTLAPYKFKEAKAAEDKASADLLELKKKDDKK